MTDNFFVEDLIRSVGKDTTVERYLPVGEHREPLLAVMRGCGVVRRDDVTGAVLEKVGETCGEEVARLFARFLHLYDFKPEKLREIRRYEGTEAYDELAGLLRLPGVRLLRAELYYHSGVTLETLAERPTGEIRALVGEYISRENRSETVPLPKEVNCHRAVAKMILHSADAPET